MVLAIMLLKGHVRLLRVFGDPSASSVTDDSASADEHSAHHRLSTVSIISDYVENALQIPDLTEEQRHRIDVFLMSARLLIFISFQSFYAASRMQLDGFFKVRFPFSEYASI